MQASQKRCTKVGSSDLLRALLLMTLSHAHHPGPQEHLLRWRRLYLGARLRLVFGPECSASSGSAVLWVPVVHSASPFAISNGSNLRWLLGLWACLRLLTKGAQWCQQCWPCCWARSGSCWSPSLWTQQSTKFTTRDVAKILHSGCTL